ncbi:Centrin [Hexamita inflata]|uniref:Centrin n=1 Tax=Hexamita inflata TaxID=28002 RepID=A0AA86U509_9EUKA|nr:Centrin [Hexamita inflata]CAI9941124.1 Centrin [Hexamita inflata]
MKKRQEPDLSEQQKRDLREAFDLFDSDGTGKVPSKEIKVAMRALGFEPTREELKKFIQEVDSANTGLIDLNDFIRIITTKMGEKDSREDILKSFKLFDDDHTGKISFKNIKRVATELNEKLSDEEIQEMIDEADRDQDGLISEEEFIRIIRATNLF